MRKTISIKLKFNITVLILLTILGIGFTEITSLLHKKVFLQQLHNELNFKLEHTSEYLSFNEQIRNKTLRRLEFDDEVYNNFKKYTKREMIPGDGSIFIINKKGDYLIHPTDEGKNVSQEFHINKILSSTLEANSFLFDNPGDLRTKYVLYKYNNTFKVYTVIILDWNSAISPIKRLKAYYQLLFLVLIIIVFAILNRFNKNLFSSLNEILKTTKHFANADFTNHIRTINSKEIHAIAIEYDRLKTNIKSDIKFAEDICNEKLDTEFTPVNSTDSLGKSLLRIRDNMKTAKAEQERRQIEDEKQNWLNKGLANFSDLLRLHNDDLKKHSDIIIQNLVSYINGNQGAIFIVNRDDENNRHLELISAFAYDTRKYIEKTIPFGEGLVGTCAIEKRTIFLKEVPEDYIEITSGLGDANPRCILIVPIKIEEDVLGVLEIASFKVFEKHEIDFVERIMESVASTLSSAKINAQTASLLSRFELQNEQMKSQEEEMRQNMEEMQAVQEGSELQKEELEKRIKILSEELFFCEYHTNGNTSNIHESFANLLGFELNEIINGTIEDHINIGFLKSDKDHSKLIEEILHSEKPVTVSNIYNVSNQEILLDEKFITLRDNNDAVIRIIRLAKNNTQAKQMDDEINDLILKERSLLEELNKAKETISFLENTIKNNK